MLNCKAWEEFGVLDRFGIKWINWCHGSGLWEEGLKDEDEDPEWGVDLPFEMVATEIAF